MQFKAGVWHYVGFKAKQNISYALHDLTAWDISSYTLWHYMILQTLAVEVSFNSISQPGGWGLESTHICPHSGIFNRPKKNSNPHTLFRDFRADKPFTTCGQAAEFKFQCKFDLVPAIWHSFGAER